jgi:hypothetical protein
MKKDALAVLEAKTEKADKRKEHKVLSKKHSLLTNIVLNEYLYFRFPGSAPGTHTSWASMGQLSSRIAGFGS